MRVPTMGAPQSTAATNAPPAQGIGGLLSSFGDAYRNMQQRDPEFVDYMISGLLGPETIQGKAYAKAAQQRADRLSDERKLAQQAGQFDRTYAQNDRQFDITEQRQRDQMARQGAQWNKSYALEASEAADRRAARSGTAEFLKANQRPADEIALAQSGNGAEAMRLYQSRVYPKRDLETIYDDQGREQRGYFGTDGGFVPVGGAKAPAGSDGKLTEDQSKSLNYVMRGNAALSVLDGEGEGSANPGVGDNLADWQNQTVSTLPLGNHFTSSTYQQADQAGREFLSAILRKDSGAGITNQEMDIYGKTYLPQPGDGADVLKQKRAARRQALDAIETSLGSARSMIPGRGATASPGGPTQAQTGTVPSNLKGKYGLR